MEKLGRVAALGAALHAADAEAGLKHRTPDMPPDRPIADVVAPISRETQAVMDHWGIQFNGKEIRLRLDPRDDGRPLAQSDRNLALEVTHQGSDTVTFTFQEPDGGFGFVSIRRGKEAGSYNFEPPHATHQPHRESPRADAGTPTGQYGEYGRVRVYSDIHHKPHQPTPPGTEWMWHTGHNGERDWWYVGPSNDTGAHRRP